MKRIIVFLLIAMTACMSAIKVCADVPTKSTDLSDAEIIKLCTWLISTPPSDDASQKEMRDAVQSVILDYVMNTEKFSLTLGTPASRILDISGDHDETDSLLSVYVAGETIYCLEHKLADSNADSFAFAAEGVLFQYSLMPKHPLKELNKFLKMDKDKRHTELVKFYNKYDSK